MSVSANEKARYLAMKGQGGSKILHIEHWSTPDAETSLTGIDYYERPRDCRLRLAELYPMLELPIPATNAPIPRPKLDLANTSSNAERHSVRWGDSETDTFLHGEQFFKTEEDVFSFHPLQHADFSDWKFVVESKDFSRKGMDIYTTAGVPFMTAVLGGEAEVRMPNGKKIVCKIPKGTDAGRKIRIRGKGIHADFQKFCHKNLL